MEEEARHVARVVDESERAAEESDDARVDDVAAAAAGDTVGDGVGYQQELQEGSGWCRAWTRGDCARKECCRGQRRLNPRQRDQT